MTMKKIAKCIAAYIALLVFYGGDIATASIMMLLVGGLYGCYKIEKMEGRR